MVNKEKVISVLYQFDDKYAPYAGISITSLFENNKHIEKIKVYILGDGLSQENCDKLRKTGQKYSRQIIFIDIEPIKRTLLEIKLPMYRGSHAANMRLFLPYISEIVEDKVLYLDSDTIVSGKIDKIFDIDIGSAPVAMVLDSLGMKHGKELGLQNNYYNSGVVLFQMNIWREHNICDKIVDYVKNVRSAFSMPDQDLLNLVCKDNIYRLGLEYNFQPVHVAFSIEEYISIYKNENYYSNKEMKEARTNVCINHFFRFCGEFPWYKGNVHPNRELYEKYKEVSFWKYEDPYIENLNVMFRLEKILYKFMPRKFFLWIFKIAHEYTSHKENKKQCKK